MPSKIIAALAAALLASTTAQAALVVSSQPTKGVVCNAGLCATKAARAFLNVGDLAALLASGDVTVKTGSEARDIAIDASLSWASAHKLTLDSYRQIAVRQPVVVEGSGAAVSVTLGDGSGQGALIFTGRGRILFRDLGDGFDLGGQPYTLVPDVATLAADVAANASGNYALADDCDAGKAGAYDDAPVTTFFHGSFEGLGNTIRHLKIHTRSQGQRLGLFGTNEGAIDGVNLTDIDIRSGKLNQIGGVVALNLGSVSHVKVSGNIRAAGDSTVGMVVGQSTGSIADATGAGTIDGPDSPDVGVSKAGGVVGFVQAGDTSSSRSSVSLQVGSGWLAGGLIGDNMGSLLSSYATGAVISGDGAIAGGLMGVNFSDSVENTYATGFTLGGQNSVVGGLVGRNTSSGHIMTSYSVGGVASGSGNGVGGFVGDDQGTLTQDYFDIDTSGQSHGDGTNTGDAGITGLTTAQFTSGLPTGFAGTVWAEGSGINSGYPYLRHLPPH
jgi:hypothetical protein